MEAENIKEKLMGNRENLKKLNSNQKKLVRMFKKMTSRL